MLTLWDILSPVLRLISPGPKPPARRPLRRDRANPRKAKARPKLPATLFEPVAAPPNASGAKQGTGRGSAKERYQRVINSLLAEHRVTVRRWRTSMSGIAWEQIDARPTPRRWIEAPRPRTPLSTSIVLHEIGHHAIGFNRYKPRCLEEYHAWRWSLEAMERHGLTITEQVRYRVALSLWYAVAKARRRGIKAIPPELAPYQQRPRKPVRKSA